MPATTIRPLLLIVCIFYLQSFSLRAQESRPAAIAKIEHALAKYGRQNTFHGGLLIARAGEVLLEQTYGENTSGVPNQVSTPFHLASIGKMFTGVVYAQLKAAGKINYGDFLIDHLTEFKNDTFWQPIKISHLLTHSSGIADIFNRSFIEEKTRELDLTIEEYFAHYGQQPYSYDHFRSARLAFPPGSKFSYSNSGYLLLGLVAEQILSAPYKDYVEAHILAPARMTNTQIGTSYGGNTTTLRDLYQFAEAFSSLDLIDQAHFDEMTSGKILVNNKKDNQWGYGCELITKYPTKIITHKGGSNASKAQLLIFPETGYVAIVYANNNRVGYNAFLNLVKLIQRELSKI